MALTHGVLMVFAACAATDGDTIRCGQERIRLAVIDSPEMSEPGGREAKEHMRLLIDGKRVTCEIRGRERYGRLLGKCSTDATPDLGAEMLRSGHAIRYSKRCHGRQAECKR